MLLIITLGTNIEKVTQKQQLHHDSQKFISYILEEAINLIHATIILTEDGRTKTRLKTNNVILLV